MNVTLQPRGRSVPLGFVILFFPRFAVRQYPVWVPYELLTLGTALSHAGYEVQLLDERLVDDAVQVAARRAEEALFIGVSSRPGDQVVRALELFHGVKERFPRVPTVWGGWFPSSFPRECIAHKNVDYVVRGAADDAIVELAERLRLHNGDVTGIAGIESARQGFPACHNVKRPLTDINRTPQVEWRRFPMELYVTADGCISHYTSRGCPGNCRFCGVPRLYPAIWSGYSTDRMLGDITYFVENLGVTLVKFQDVDFFADVDRVRTFCKGLLSAGLKIRWVADIRVACAAHFDEEFWELLAAAGCCELELGAEAGADSQLEAVFKECCREEIIRVVKNTVAHGIHARVNFVLGFPGETPTLLQESLNLIGELARFGPGVRFHFYRFAPSPSTRLGRQVWIRKSERHSGRAPESIQELNSIAVNYQNPDMFWLSADMEDLIRETFEIDLPLACYNPARLHGGWRRILLKCLGIWARMRLRFGWESWRFERPLLRLTRMTLPMSREFDWAADEAEAKELARRRRRDGSQGFKARLPQGEQSRVERSMAKGSTP